MLLFNNSQVWNQFQKTIPTNIQFVSRRGWGAFSSCESLMETEEAIGEIKMGMMAGPVPARWHLYPEMIKNLGEKARGWLTRCFTEIIQSCRIPTTKSAIVVAILKPGKDVGKTTLAITDQSCCSAACLNFLKDKWRSVWNPPKMRKIALTSRFQKRSRNWWAGILALTSEI